MWAQSEGALKLLRAPKLALVIGNGTYKDAPLKNPANDARAMSDALVKIGFEVTERLDATRAQMTSVIRSYTRTLAARKCVGVFYYAGHGVQLAWTNYLLPVDAEIGRLEDVPKQALAVTGLVSGITKAANPMNVIILDACRDNPLGRVKPNTRGLSQMDAPEAMFKRVRLSVRRTSKGAQLPWESTSLEEDFYFLPSERLKKLSDEEKQRLFKEELAVWQQIQNSQDPAPLEDYLRRYPSGNYVELAQLQLDRVLAARGENRIEIASQRGNPFTKGSAYARISKVGDTVTYRALDLRSRAERRTYTATVIKVTDTEVIRDDGFISDLLGNQRRNRQGYANSPNQFVPLEFQVGKRWRAQFEVTDPQGVTWHAEQELRIVARERVTVPAGSFNAFRLEARGTSSPPQGPTESQVTRWHIPDFQWPVACDEVRRRGGKEVFTERLEMLSYKLA